MTSTGAEDYSLSRVFAQVRTLLEETRWWLIVGGVVLAVALVLLVLNLPNRYTAEATVLPPGGGSTDFGLLRQVVGMTGLSGAGSVESYLQLYPVVARSGVVAGKVFESKFDGRSVASIIGEVEQGYDPTDEERERWLRSFRDAIEAEADLRTGYFRLGFTSEVPEFSAYVVNALLDRMDSYFREVVRGDARRRRVMIERRLDDVSDSLRVAEARLEAFRMANQISADSPRLAMREMRLLREVEVNGAIVIELRRQLEIATVEEESISPIMNVLDRAKVPQLKSGPPRARYCVVGFVVGELIIFVLVLAVRRWRSQSRRGSVGTA